MKSYGGTHLWQSPPGPYVVILATLSLCKRPKPIIGASQYIRKTTVQQQFGHHCPSRDQPRQVFWASWLGGSCTGPRRDSSTLLLGRHKWTHYSAGRRWRGRQQHVVTCWTRHDLLTFQVMLVWAATGEQLSVTLPVSSAGLAQAWPRPGVVGL